MFVISPHGTIGLITSSAEATEKYQGRDWTAKPVLRQRERAVCRQISRNACGITTVFLAVDREGSAENLGGLLRSDPITSVIR